MAVSIDKLIDRVDASGLLARAEVQAIVDGLAAGQKPEDGQQLARLLVKAKKLTAYQAQEIYVGRGASLVLGNYVVLDKLGQGGMGLVLKAEHRRMQRLVALKILSPDVTRNAEMIARFEREVKAAAKLRHPNIVAADDADEAKGVHFLVMEYVEGSDLSVTVRKTGTLPVAKAVTCILQAARGLEYAHQRGVVHRDIKPSNLLLATDGTVKVLDLGLARLESAGTDQDQLTGTGQIMGTIDYMSPEQALDTKNADARADIYSLGITLWYLLTGRVVFTGETMLAKLLAHRETAIPSLTAACPAAQPQLNHIFARMVAKSPDDRYQTMTEVIADLEALNTTETVPRTTSEPGEDTRLKAFLNSLDPPAARTPGPSVAVARRTKMSRTAAELQPTVIVNSNEADTDPQTQTSLDRRPRGGTRRAKDVAGKRGIATPRTQPKVRMIVNLLQHMGIVYGMGALFVISAAIIFFVQTNAGVIRVEINDPEIEVAIQGTDITFKQADQGKDIKLSPGEKTLLVERGDFRFETRQLILKRGETVTVHVELLAGQVQVRQGDNVLGRKDLPRSEPTSAPTAEVAKNVPIPTELVPPLAIAPFEAVQARKHQEAWAKYQGVAVEREIELPGGQKLMMVLIPPGEFLMGSPADEAERRDEEGPQHKVRITKAFYMGVTEVTQGEWFSVMKTQPWEGEALVKEGANYPATYVSWDDAVEYCEKLSVLEGKEYRLPTEAEWEYACRGGNSTSYTFGVDSAQLRNYGWFKENADDIGEQYAHEVGGKQSNPFGLYDMHGNVWEWCSDWLGPYSASAAVDPQGPSTGSGRVLRGGSWRSAAGSCRAANRGTGGPTSRHTDRGFRLALSSSGQ